MSNEQWRPVVGYETTYPEEGIAMSNVICSLCRGDHTYEEHMEAERDMLDMSVDRHPAGKAQAAYHGESEMDRVWRTIPRDQPGVTPAPEPPVLAPRAAPYRSLLTPANIATAASIAALIVMSTGIVLAWFLDWKLP